jgi:hypothetical protein
MGRKRSWLRVVTTAWVAGWYLLATTGVPLAVTLSLTPDAPGAFPCASHLCHCRTAGQCLESCCCFPREVEVSSSCPMHAKTEAAREPMEATHPQYRDLASGRTIGRWRSSSRPRTWTRTGQPATRVFPPVPTFGDRTKFLFLSDNPEQIRSSAARRYLLLYASACTRRDEEYQVPLERSPK